MTIPVGLITFAGLVSTFFSPSDFVIERVKRKTAHVQSIDLQKFESEFIYPFSDTEQFNIQHGANGNYFSFFKSLGKPYYFVARAKKNKMVTKKIGGKKLIVRQKQGEIAAAVCGVLRQMPTYNGKKMTAWYICDLKVDEKYQGDHLPLTMIKAVSYWRYMQCPRGFAICMNPPTGEPKAAAIFKKHGPYPDIDTKTLNLYTLSAEQVEQSTEALSRIMRRRNYMKPNQKLIHAGTFGMKDYEIINNATRTKRPWRLWHLQPGSQKSEVQPLEADATYMICAVHGTPLDNDFRTLLGAPSSTAQILSYGMKHVDFNYLTSNQI